MSTTYQNLTEMDEQFYTALFRDYVNEQNILEIRQLEPYVQYHHFTTTEEALEYIDTEGQRNRTSFLPCLREDRVTRTEDRLSLAVGMYQDFDLPNEEGLQKLNEFAEEYTLPYSALINSGRHYHPYWFIDPPIDLADPGNLNMYKNAHRAFAAALGVTASTTNLTLPMGCPGTYNTTTEVTVKRTVLEVYPERIYSFVDIHQVIMETPTGTTTQVTPTHTFNFVLNPEEHEYEYVGDPEAGLDAIYEHCSFIDYCIRNEETLPEPLWKGLASIHFYFAEYGHQKFHEASEGHPKYDPSEADRKLGETRTTWSCEKLHEEGYHCPNRLACETALSSQLGLEEKLRPTHWVKGIGRFTMTEDANKRREEARLQEVLERIERERQQEANVEVVEPQEVDPDQVDCLQFPRRLITGVVGRVADLFDPLCESSIEHLYSVAATLFSARYDGLFTLDA